MLDLARQIIDEQTDTGYPEDTPTDMVFAQAGLTAFLRLVFSNLHPVKDSQDAVQLALLERGFTGEVSFGYSINGDVQREGKPITGPYMKVVTSEAASREHILPIGADPDHIEWIDGIA